MKKFIVIVIAAALSSALFADDRPARSVVIGKKNSAVATAANSEIVVAPDASRATKFAAGELQDFLSRILGGKIPVVNKITDSKTSFILGVNQWSKEAKIGTEKLVRDAFIIKTAGSRIYIAGTDSPEANPEKAIQRGGVWSQYYERGTLFGVYDFLERFAGVRMYFPGELGTVIPKKDKLVIPEISIYDRPDFTQRKVSTYWDGTYFEGKNPNATINPAKTLNNYRLRLETEYIPCCHGTNHFQYIKRFGKTNPEYFALLANGKRSADSSARHGGQLCWTSGITEEMYKDVRSYLKGEKADVRKIPTRSGNSYAWGVNTALGEIVDIMPQDGFQPCQCDKCKAAYTNGETHYATELIWGNTVKIANRLKTEGIKGYVTQMAYRPYRRVPKFDIPDNVLVMVAETGPWLQYNKAQMAKDNAEIKAWVDKLGRKVWIWTYVNKGSTLLMPGIPQMSPRAYGEYYTNIAPVVFGAFAESESDRFLYNYLNYYIFAKVAWDNKADYNALLKEHYQLMFGKAAPVMQKFYESLEDNWVKKIAGRVVDTPLGPVGAPPSDYDLWHKVYTPEFIANMDRELTRAASMVAKNSLEAKRIALIRQEYYHPLLAAAEKYRKTTTAVDGLKFHITDKPGKELYLIPFDAKGKGITKKQVKTTVQVWRTADNLCVKFNCEEPRMTELVALKRQPDDENIWKDSSVEIFLNPSGDRKVYYQIMVNAEGSLTDQKFTRIGAKATNDIKWNSGATVQTDKKASSWSAIVTIPLKNLPGVKNAFPANFTRNRVLSGTGDYEPLYIWSPFARGFHDLENFGTITVEKDKNVLINSDFSILPARSKRHFGVWEGSKWVGGWIGPNAEDTALDSTTLISGPVSMKLVSAKGQTALTQHNMRQLKPSTRYRLSFYVKLQDVKPTAKSGGFVANLWDDKNCWFPKHNFPVGTTGWLYQSYEFTTGAKTNQGKITAYLRMRLHNATGTAWIDDVRLEELP